MFLYLGYITLTFVAMPFLYKARFLSSYTKLGMPFSSFCKIRGTVLLTQFHFAICSLYDSVTDTCQP